MTWEEAVRALIDDPDRKELVEACYFDPPLTRAAARFSESAEWQAMQSLIGRARGVAVDIGAGNGIVSFALARDGWRTIAVEPNPSTIVGSEAIRRLSADTNTKIDVRAGYGEGLPLEDGEAALVIARQVLHHARDLPAFAREIARVLSPGGRLISARDHVVSSPKQLQAFFDIHPLHRLYGGENAFTREEYRAALEGAGLIIEQEIGPFASPINYAPHTPETLRREIVEHLGPLGVVARVALAPRPLLLAVLHLLSAIDRRPGRLISFVCRKL